MANQADLTPSVKTAAIAVRLEMLRRGWTQADLAREAKTTQAHVSEVINGVKRYEKIRLRIERALGVRVWSSSQEVSA